MTEELAVVRDANVGMRDARSPILWFEVELLSGGALLCFDLETTGAQLIKDAQVYRVSDLNGRSCIVRKEGMTVKFARWK